MLPPYIPNYDNFKPGEDMVYYSGPYWDQREIDAAIRTLTTGKWLPAGIEVAKFQAKFAKKFKVKWSHMVNSGSSANLVMITALKKYFKWSDNAEIIVSPVGFPTTIAPIIQNNLTPRFVDIEFRTLNFDIEKIENAITDKTVAIFVSPVLGNPPNLDVIKDICNRRNLLLIGDNCDSLGSTWNGKYIHDYYFSWSCSFYPAHHISTGEGGMISSNDGEFIALCRSISWWGRACHPAGTSIYTKKGLKNIEDVKVGDFVLTHMGNWKPVCELLNRQYKGKLYTIKSKRNEDIQATGEHPFYVIKNNTYQWVKAEELKKGDFLLTKIMDCYSETVNDILVTYDTIDSIKKFILPAEGGLFRLMGYYLAEGSLVKSKKGSNGKNRPHQKNKYFGYRIEFAFHKNEIEYMEDVKDLMLKYFGVKGQIKIKGNAANLRFKSRKAYEFLLKYCGKISYKKKLPENFVQMPLLFLNELLKGYWRGDGSHDFQSVSLSSSSKNLIYQLRNILYRNYITPGFGIRTPEKHTKAIVKDKLIEAKRNQYSLICYGDNAKSFSDLLNEDFSDKIPHKSEDHLDKAKHYVLHEITDIISNDMDTEVYNFEVENEHSYHANGLASHNCYCVGAANQLPNGTCGKRFQNWLEEYDGVIDHKYVFEHIGYNLKPLELQGSIGLVQLEKFDDIENRRFVYKFLIETFFDHFRGIKIVIDNYPGIASWFGVPIICETQELREKLVKHFEDNKIQTRHYFAGNILIHPGYKHLGDYKQFPNANKALSHVFFLGCSPSYNDKVLCYIEDVVNKWQN